MTIKIRQLARDWYFIRDTMIHHVLEEIEYQGYTKKQAIKLFKKKYKLSNNQ